VEQVELVAEVMVKQGPKQQQQELLILVVAVAVASGANGNWRAGGSGIVIVRYAI
jgi:hypothetical protein